jgi:hypothetical protein
MKALDFYTIDKGKEHILIKQDISKLYRYLTLLETD